MYTTYSIPDRSIHRCKCGRATLAGRSQCDRCRSQCQSNISAGGRLPPTSSANPQEQTRQSRSPESSPKTTRSRTSSSGSAKQVLSDAMASDGPSSLFGHMPHRTPIRSDSSSSTTSRSQSPLPTRSAATGLAVPRGSMDRSYSPMAAGFASLSSRDSSTVRARSTRSSLDDAKLFEGAA